MNANPMINLTDMCREYAWTLLLFIDITQPISILPGCREWKAE